MAAALYRPILGAGAIGPPSASLSLSPIETLRYPMTGSSTHCGRIAGRSGEAECRIHAGRVVVPAAIRAIAIVPVVPWHIVAVSHTSIVIADAASWLCCSRRQASD